MSREKNTGQLIDLINVVSEWISCYKHAAIIRIIRSFIMKITEADVEHVARLARLKLTPGEKELFAGQMDAILGYVEKLKELNTDGIVPTSHAVPMENSFREDTVQSSIGLGKALSNAPERAGSFFAVPKVIE
jgi:aspartyl-tRNA(Asn)/glutamyl-tRNA(Gln) amidotransferase subunit C